MHRTTHRPDGLPTRGKTAPGRLRRLDRLVLLLDGPLLRRRHGPWEDAAFVDLGYGETPTTTLESARAFRSVNPGLPVIGIEIDPARVASAAPFQDDRTRFRRGGFELPLEPGESVRMIRAMNVLRQYPEDASGPAHAALLARLLPGGLLIEGTSSPDGDLLVVHRIRAGDPADHTVLFSVDPYGLPAEGPRALQTRLPKDLIHRVVPGEPIADLMDAWDLAWRQARPAATFGPWAHWRAAIRELTRTRPDVVRRPGLARRGALLWRPPDR